MSTEDGIVRRKAYGANTVRDRREKKMLDLTKFINITEVVENRVNFLRWWKNATALEKLERSLAKSKKKNGDKHLKTKNLHNIIAHLRYCSKEIGIKNAEEKILKSYDRMSEKLLYFCSPNITQNDALASYLKSLWDSNKSRIKTMTSVLSKEMRDPDDFLQQAAPFINKFEEISKKQMLVSDSGAEKGDQEKQVVSTDEYVNLVRSYREKVDGELFIENFYTNACSDVCTNPECGGNMIFDFVISEYICQKCGIMIYDGTAGSRDYNMSSNPSVQIHLDGDRVKMTKRHVYNGESTSIRTIEKVQGLVPVVSSDVNYIVSELKTSGKFASVKNIKFVRDELERLGLSQHYMNASWLGIQAFGSEMQVPRFNSAQTDLIEEWIQLFRGLFDGAVRDGKITTRGNFPHIFYMLYKFAQFKGWDEQRKLIPLPTSPSTRDDYEEITKQLCIMAGIAFIPLPADITYFIK